MEENVATSPSILVIEDDQILLRMLANALSSRGFRVLEAKNGADGIALLESEKPALVLLDIHMPQMDGLTMLRHLRDTSARVPVMMLTNLSDPDYIARAAELGIVEYLVKADWEIDDIVKKVSARLKFHPIK